MAQLRVIYELRQQTLKRLASIVKKLRQTTTGSGAPSDAAIIASLPGAGILTTAALLSESSRAVAERDAPALRAYAGVAPVTTTLPWGVCAIRWRVGITTACGEKVILTPALYAVSPTAG